MKVSELSGAQLDYWVAKAEGAEDDDLGWRIIAQGMEIKSKVLDWRMSVFAPHRRWDQAGPIIDDNAIGFHPISDAEWMAEEHMTAHTGRGPTPLIAAMRAYVASKFGDEVADEEAA